MFVRVDPGDSTPIYEQIARQIKFAVASGGLRPGDRVLSVREMARRLAINPNTVARAYRDLQAEGILLPQRGLGLVVTVGAPARCRREREAWIRERLVQLVNEARLARIPPHDLRKLFLEIVDSLQSEESLP